MAEPALGYVSIVMAALLSGSPWRAGTSTAPPPSVEGVSAAPFVAQAVQQIRMQPAQLRGLDERVTDLLSRADHLMNVVLPAAFAARPRR